MFGLLGFDAFDLITDILANRRVIKEPSGFDLLTAEQEDTFDIYSDDSPKLPHFKQERAPTVATQVGVQVLSHLGNVSGVCFKLFM